MKRIGIEIDGESIRCASLGKGKPKLTPKLQKGYGISALDGGDVLVRSVNIPTQQKKAIAKALPYQIENVLPGSREDKVVCQKKIEAGKGVTISLFVAPHTAIKRHIDQAKKRGVNPESISSTQVALAAFAAKYVPSDKRILIIHMKEKRTLALCVSGTRVLHSTDFSIGFKDLVSALLQDRPSLSKEKGVELLCKRSLFDVKGEEFPHLYEVIKRLQMEGSRLLHYLLEKGKGVVPEEIIATGLAASIPDFEALYKEHLQKAPFDGKEERLYAAPLGLLLDKEPIEFRTAPFLHPSHKKRLLFHSILFGLLMSILGGTLHFGGKHLLSQKEEAITKEIKRISPNATTLAELEKEIEVKWSAMNRHKRVPKPSDLLNLLTQAKMIPTHIHFSLDPMTNRAKVVVHGHGGDIDLLKEKFTVTETPEGYQLEGEYEK